MLLSVSLFSIVVKAQITYSNWWLNINNAPKHPWIPMTIGTWPGFYWTCNTSNFFMLDVSPANPRIAGTGNEIVFYNTDTGTFNSIQVANVYNHSDARAKENVKTMTTGLDAILGLRPVTYKWKRPEISQQKTKIAVSDTTQTVSYGPDDTSLQYGFLAQEVEKVIPDVVKTNEDGHKMVNYLAIIPVLVQAVQELQATVDSQAQQIERLTNSKISSADQKTNNKIVSCTPNPTESNVLITTKLDEGVQTAALQISNLSGKKEKSIMLTQDMQSVSENVSSLAPGMHIVSLVVNGVVCDTARLIRE